MATATTTIELAPTWEEQPQTGQELIGLLKWPLRVVYVLAVVVQVVPLTFLVLLAYAISSAPAQGFRMFLKAVLVAFLVLPFLYVIPVAAAWLLPLPVYPFLVMLVVLRLQDMALLALVGKVPLQYNLRNLAVRWRITLLTALAFTLVVGILTVMLAFVNGMFALTQGSAQPGNVIVVSDGATDELFSNLGYGDTSDIERQPRVCRDTDGKALCSREVYIVANQPIPNAVKGGRQRRFLQVRGLDDPEMTGRVHGLNLYPGGAWFSAAGVQPAAEGARYTQPSIQAVLGEGIARELGKDFGRPTLAVGDVFDVGPRRWIVTGILRSAGSTFDSEIWAKRTVVGPLFGKSNYTSLVLRTDNAADAKKLSEDLTKNFKKSALNAQPETEYYDKLNATNQQFLVAIIFVAIVMAIGGVFGVMNTMFAAISQRINDIAVLRILGFAPWQLLVSFLLESLMIALVGGLIGCGLGALCDGWTASSIVSGGQGGGKSVVLKLTVDANIVAAGLMFTLLMGGLGGLLPALSAMRLKPLESLR